MTAASYRAVLVDDEAPARRLIRTYLEAWPRIEVVAECADGIDAVRRLGELRPDLVFLDIQMPGLDGFQVLDALESPPPRVVFSTAYDEHAVRAFDVEACDYLLKPYERARFDQAVQRALGRPADTARLAALLDARSAGGLHPERLLVRHGSGYVPVPVSDVLWIEAAGDYARIHARGGTYLSTRPLGALERRLSPERFLRVHRSRIVAVEALARLDKEDAGGLVAELVDGTRLRVSRSYAAALKRHVL